MIRVFRSLGEIDSRLGHAAVTIGKFDGMHEGHRRMLGVVSEEAAARGLTPVVLTFDRNPLALLRPEACPEPLVSNEQKIELFARAGLEVAVMLEFDEAFSALSPEKFVRTVLVEALGTRVVVVGADYRFGAGGVGTTQTLRELGAREGFEVVVIDDVLREGRRVSSTWVRELLEEGDVAEARRLLGRAPTVRGVVVRGAQRGRALGFPTANLAPEVEGFIPRDGVYAGWLVRGVERLPAAVSVGDNPTFAGVPQRQVEAHVLDRELDLYGETVEVEFVDRVRDMERFESVDALITAMNDDVHRVREVLAEPAP